MEHLGCVLQTDFSDFYDGQLGATSTSHIVVLERYRHKRLPIEQQIQYLEDAQLPHLSLWSLRSASTHLQPFGETLAQNEAFLALMEIVVFDKTGTPARCSYLDAAQLNPDRWAMNYFPAQPQGGQVLTYVQIGTLSLWVMRHSVDDWRAGHGQCHTRVVACCKHLAPKHLQHLPHPLFSIDFLCVEGVMQAINYDIAPHLARLGVPQIYTDVDVAAALMDRLGSPPLPELIDECN